MGIKTVRHSSYSPDLVLWDLWLFPKLRGCRYETIEEMKEAVTKIIDTLTQEDFHGPPEVVETLQQVHCSWRRLRRRVLEFYVCTDNKSALTKKSLETYLMILVFLKWTREELKQIDERARKLLTMHKALHFRDNVDRLYVSRKEVGKGFASFEDSVDTSMQRLEDYIETTKKDWLQPLETTTRRLTERQ